MKALALITVVVAFGAWFGYMAVQALRELGY